MKNSRLWRVVTCIDSLVINYVGQCIMFFVFFHFFFVMASTWKMPYRPRPLNRWRNWTIIFAIFSEFTRHFQYWPVYAFDGLFNCPFNIESAQRIDQKQKIFYRVIRGGWRKLKVARIRLSAAGNFYLITKEPIFRRLALKLRLGFFLSITFQFLEQNANEIPSIDKRIMLLAFYRR